MKNKMDDRIKWLDAHTEEYLRILEEMSACGESSRGIQRSHFSDGSKKSPQKSRRRI